jgi:Cdc6-like AAA superfamily ATPase
MTEGKTSWRAQAPDFLQFLETTLQQRMRLHEEVLGYHIYFVDLSEWKLRFSDRTPFIHVCESDLAALPARELRQSLLDVVRSRDLADRNPVILIDGPGQELQTAFKAEFNPIMVLDAAAQAAVRGSRRPSAELLDRLGAQVELASLVPYETSRPVTGSRFFGREAEVHRIVASGDGNFAIMGIRRIGKTSLMREVERQLREQAQERGDNDALQRILFMDCSALRSPADFVQEVVRRLRPQELVRLNNKQYPIYFPDFLHRMAQRYHGPIFFFLDEFDRVLSWQREDDTLLNALRASSIQDDSRYVIGGFREVMRAFSNLDSPLYNFARPVRLKEFTYEQTLNMVTGPLEKLGVEFEKRNDIVARIFNETAAQPNLIQFYCSILVERLDRRHSRSITPDSLFSVYSNEDFRAFILSTFMDNTTHLEKAVVFAVVANSDNSEPFTVETIDTLLEKRGIQVPLSDLDHVCRDLELSGTLTVRGRHYRFATPIFPRLLRENYDVEYLFRKIQQEGIW